MNETNDDQPTSVPEEEPEQSDGMSDGMSETREAFRDLENSMKKAFQAGAHDARNAVKDAVPQAKQEFAKGIHDIACGFAYLASFGLAMAREITPEPVSEGFNDGSEAGRKAAEDLLKKKRPAESESGVDEGSSDKPDSVPV